MKKVVLGAAASFLVLLGLVVLGPTPASSLHAWSQLANVRTALMPPPRPVLKNLAGSAPNLSAEAWVAAFIDRGGDVEALVAKNGSKVWPLASVSKLMTALVASEQSNLTRAVTLTPEMVREEEDAGFYRAGDIFLAGDLLYSLLIESSNNAAFVLAGEQGENNFVQKMNALGAKLGLSQTHFVNPSGLDPEVAGAPVNTATANDLLTLAQYLIAHHPELLAISREPLHDIYLANGLFHHTAHNTDELLRPGEVWPWPNEVVGSKTGSTDRAGKNLLLILRDKSTGGYLITIVLGATSHFTDTRTLLDWVYQAYQF